MQQIKISLSKQRKIGLIILLSIAIIGYIVSVYAPFSPPNYITSEYRMPLVYGLIGYKIIELGIFYLLFYRKHYLNLLEEAFQTHLLDKFEKNAKRFFFLVPQGSIVFGILSYKLSGNIAYLWLFLLIATTTLFLVNPTKLKSSDE